MNAPIYYVGGSKGGVGKSKMSFVLIDYLLSQEKKVLLVESDNSNPDVYKTHEPYSGPNLICGITDLDSQEGWMNLVDLLEDNPEHFVVINSAARSNMGIGKYGATFRETLPELDRKLFTFWMLNRQRDAVELLKGFLDSFPEAPVNACRNLHFGEPDKFEIYNTSKVREIVEANGLTLDFPSLSPRVADKLYSDRLPIWIAQEQFRISCRVELSRWKNLCGQQLEKAFEEK